MSPSKNKRFYLDYNATAPLSKSFISALLGGLIPDGNPSLVHSTGKSVAKSIEEVVTYLYGHFNLDRAKFNLVFHSGATEAANTFLQLKKGEVIAFLATDHSCVREQSARFSENSVEVIELPVGEFGQIDVDEVINILKPNSDKKIILHLSQMNNEIGAVLDLADAAKIKDETGCLVYIDSVQAPGRVENYAELSDQLDVYTYSGHKFGALKGIGFSFIRNNFEVTPLILGGGQQGAVRSGTMNTHGIISLKYALEDLTKAYLDEQKLKQMKEKVSKLLEQNENLLLIPNTSLNTVNFIHKKSRADAMLIHFDLAGIDVSSGSACSSGSIEASHVIKGIGQKDLALNSIRISLGFENLEDEQEILDKISKVIAKL